jgi:hypothetical protein
VVDQRGDGADGDLPLRRLRLAHAAHDRERRVRRRALVARVVYSAAMNVFVLCTGRCGSATFAQACTHITNYSCGHETRIGMLGKARLAYPPDHIEVDNRLSWLLGRVEEAYGDDAYYVHLWRGREETAASYARRWGTGIVASYATGILGRLEKMTPDATPQAVCEDHWDTVEANIRHFLRDKTRRLDFPMEEGAERFPIFWEAIGAVGDLPAALEEWTRNWNDSAREQNYPPDLKPARHAHYPGKGEKGLRRFFRRRSS